MRNTASMRDNATQKSTPLCVIVPCHILLCTLFHYTKLYLLQAHVSLFKQSWGISNTHTALFVGGRCGYCDVHAREHCQTCEGPVARVHLEQCHTLASTRCDLAAHALAQARERCETTADHDLSKVGEKKRTRRAARCTLFSARARSSRDARPSTRSTSAGSVSSPTKSSSASETRRAPETGTPSTTTYAHHWRGRVRQDQSDALQGHRRVRGRVWARRGACAVRGRAETHSARRERAALGGAA